MGGVFNVIVAEFGEPDSQGTIQTSEPGYWLSSWLAKQLQDQFADTNLGIEVWHDQLNKPPSNPMIGIVVDEAQAKAQIEKFGADVPSL